MYHSLVVVLSLSWSSHARARVMLTCLAALLHRGALDEGVMRLRRLDYRLYIFYPDKKAQVKKIN